MGQKCNPIGNRLGVIKGWDSNWFGDLPSNGFSYRIDKQLTFVFDDGREIIVKNDRLVPDQIGRGFFNIELEMTTKH